MKTASCIFANITAGLEDLHAIAVEGLNSGASPDLQAILARQLQSGFRGLKRKAAGVADQSQKRRRETS